MSIIVISCRCGDHVLLSGGPLVSRTGLCSQYEVTALHTLGQGRWGLGRRAQGLSLPLQLQVGMCTESKTSETNRTASTTWRKIDKTEILINYNKKNGICEN